MTDYMTDYDAEQAASFNSMLADFYRSPTPWIALQKAVKEIRRLDALYRQCCRACEELRPMADIGSFVVNYLPPGASIDHIQADRSIQESWAIRVPTNPLRLQHVYSETLAKAIEHYWQIAEEGGDADD